MSCSLRVAIFSRGHGHSHSYREDYKNDNPFNKRFHPDQAQMLNPIF